jgi:hypothetical protein
MIIPSIIALSNQMVSPPFVNPLTYVVPSSKNNIL